MKYLVIEIQTNSDGTVGNFVWSYDNENDAWSKYHAVLSSAAVSSIPVHSACLIGNDGNLIAQWCFRHEVNE